MNNMINSIQLLLILLFIIIINNNNYYNIYAINIQYLSSGTGFNCVLFVDGKVKCWGHGAFGVLGSGNTNDIGDTPSEMGTNLQYLDFGTGVTIAELSCGSFQSCVRINTANTIKCWGANGFGHLGYGDTNNRGDTLGEMGNNLLTINLGNSLTATKIRNGYLHQCVILNTGAIKCWGSNGSGQLGLGDTNTRGISSSEMGDNLLTLSLGTSRTIVELYIGSYSSHNCVKLNGNKLKCWGDNSFGQLGYGDTNNRGDISGEMGDSLLEVQLGTSKTVNSVTLGGYHTCVVLNEDNTLRCFGKNDYGQLGIENTNFIGDGLNEMNTFLNAANLGTNRYATMLSSGETFTCTVLDDGNLKCFGKGEGGQLGLGDKVNRGGSSGSMGDFLPNAP
jgi:alpha-tubulin suppressor-like RCC1 family protein